MFKVNPGQRIKAIGLGAAASLVLYASGFLALFTPLPILYVSVTRGRGDGLRAAVAATAVLCVVYALAPLSVPADAQGSAFPLPAVGMAPFFKPAFIWIAGVGYFAYFAVAGLVLGEGAHRRQELVRWGGQAFVASFAVLASIVLLGSAMGSEGGGFAGLLTQIIREIAAVQAQAGASSANIGFLTDNAAEAVALMKGISPSILFVFTLFTIVLNMVIGRRVIRGRKAFSHVHNVARFRMPDPAVWAMIGGGAAFFADSYLLHSGAIRIASINVMVAFGSLYFFQGLAVIAYFLQGVKLPILRTLAYVAIIIFLQTVGMLIVALGVADVWADFRLRNWKARHTDQA